MKLSDKQSEVIKDMRNGHTLHWIEGITPRCFLSKTFCWKLPIATFLKLRDLKLIEHQKLSNTYVLTELGKTIELKP